VVSALLASREGSLGQNNAGGFHNERVDQIAVEAATELDEAKRLALITEALEIAKDEVAYIPLHQQPIAWAMRDGVEVPQSADEYIRLWFANVQ